MALVFSDNFDRADSALGGVGNGWIDPSSKYQILGGKLRNTQGTTVLLRPLSEAGVKPKVVAYAVVDYTPGFYGPGVVLGSNAAGTSAYCCFFYAGGFYLRKGSPVGTDLVAVYSSGVPVDDQNWRITLAGDWSTPGQVTLTRTLERYNAGAWLLVKTDTVVDSSSPLAAGYCGLQAFAAPLDYDPVEVYDDAALALGEVLITSVSGSQLTLQAPVATGGSHNYTYQWYVALASGGAFSAIAGATSRTLVYTPPDGELRLYRCQVSDGYTSTFSLQNFGGAPFGNTACCAAAPEPPIPTFTAGTGPQTSRAIVLAGDSTSALSNYGTHVVSRLQAAADVGATITGYNCAKPGASWANWLPTAPVSGNAISVYDVTLNNYNGALKACADHASSLVFLMLGTNDLGQSRAVSAANADADTVVAAFVAAGKTVVLNHMPWRFGGINPGVYDWIAQHNAHLSTLVNGTTVLQGQTASYRRLPNHYRDAVTWPGLTNYVDSLHPADVAEGSQALAAFTVQAFLRSTDVIAPAVVAAEISLDGTTITVDFAEGISVPVLPATGATGLTLTSTGGAVTLSGPTIADARLTAALSRTVEQGETVTLSYAAGNITDSATPTHNALAPFPGFPVGNLSTADVTPPAVPTGLFATAASQSVSLVWDETADADVASFRLYRDGELIATLAPTETAYADTGLQNGTTYAYWLTAVDAAGNESDASVEAAATPDTAGVYWTWGGIKNLLGEDNAAIVSNLSNGNTDPDLTRVTADGAIADDYVNWWAGQSGYVTPIADSTTNFARIRLAANYKTAGLLYGHREWFEIPNDQLDQYVNVMEAKADAILAELFGPKPSGIDAEKLPEGDQTPPPGTFQFIPINRGRGYCGDEYSSCR